MRLFRGPDQGEPLATPAKIAHQAPNRRRFGRLILALLLVVFCAFFFRATLLTAVAAPLIFDEDVSAPASVFLLSASKAGIDEAAALYHRKLASRIIIIRQPPSRIEQMGLAGPAITTRMELVQRGVPEHLQCVLPCADRSPWAVAVAMRGWLSEHPADVGLLVCNRFGSRRARYILDRVLDRSEQNRVGVRALPDPRYDETNWWRGKEGLLDLFHSYVGLGYCYANGDAGPNNPDPSPEEYITLLDKGK